MEIPNATVAITNVGAQALFLRHLNLLPTYRKGMQMGQKGYWTTILAIEKLAAGDLMRSWILAQHSGRSGLHGVKDPASIRVSCFSRVSGMMESVQSINPKY